MIKSIIKYIRQLSTGAAIDGNREKEPDYMIIHHTAGREMINSTELEVQDYFDTTGKNRGYESVRTKRGSKTIRSYHTHPSRKKETFAQAQYAVHKYDIDSNQYGWRLVLLMKKPFENVAWHAGNWEINKRSIGIEICGNYKDKKINDNALFLIADKFQWYFNRCRDRGVRLKLAGHKDYANTSCPGQIYEQLYIIEQEWND